MNEQKDLEFLQNEGDVAEESDEITAKATWKSRLRTLKARLPEIAIYARYLLPLCAVLVLFALSLFYNVKVATSGRIDEVALGKLMINTLTGTHEYLGGETAQAKTWFFGMLSVIALLCMLVYLVALFLTGLSAYTAVRAFRAPEGSEESNRYKLIFKIAFPNRVWLFVSNLLVLIPAAYPHFVALVGGRFLAIGGENVIFILLNRPLIVVGSFCVLTLALAVAIPRFERRKKMNMFLIRHGEEPEQSEASADLEESED